MTTTNRINNENENMLNNAAPASQHELTTDHRPTTLNTVTILFSLSVYVTSHITSQDNIVRYNVNDIPIIRSPIDAHLTIFQPDTIIESNTFQRIHTSLDNKLNSIMTEDEEEEEDDDDNDVNSDTEQDLNKILNRERDEEIKQLSQSILIQQPINDETTQCMIEQLNLALDSTKRITTDDSSAASSIISVTTTTTTQHLYPSMNQTGQVKDHDRPYAKYGHLNRQLIAQECNFNLQSPPTSYIPRLHGKSFAITSWTNVSKQLVMNKIKEEFGIENIQYICIGEEISELNHQQHLHIQIIFKETIDRRKPFLDEITETHCNYQVTRNNLAWNEYIKKGGNCIEFNEFKSTTTRGSKQWPSSSSSPSSRSPRYRSPSTFSTRATSPVAITTVDLPPPPPLPSSPSPLDSSLVPKATTTKAKAEEKRQHQLAIYKQAVALAKNNVNHAMDLIQREMIDKFVERGTWYLAIFNYVHLRAQREADQRGEIDKDYIWPHSFPDCTPQLREAVNRWIKEEFNRSSRAKCLIIIGPSSTGKTSFAMSLPDRVNYFQERWNLDAWNDYARYSVYDDIPWDDFSKLNFPNKKNLLTQKKFKINATDKYRGTKEINARQPAIVLMNPDDAGSLLEQPMTDRQKKTMEYWKERASIYIMGKR
ncbi:unnamed protein product [Rotaria sordida]|uniref:Replication-associated protein n=1 Tax=Rotaria sordida TaxID=392033 RepID=A0A815VIW1_9BILA|nr:unnamed protein product [Rotaria sordida]CAF1532893.1 unnamed protein product [Rotaria sordida]